MRLARRDGLRVCRSKVVLQSRDAIGQTCRVTGLLQLKVGELMLSGRNETSQHALSRPANAGLCVSPPPTPSAPHGDLP